MSDDHRAGSLTPRGAWRRYLNHRQTDSTAESLQNYHYRLKLFVEWCEKEGIREVGQLDGWVLDSYENHRQGSVAPVTLYGEMKDLRNFVRYLARIEAVDDDLPEKVHIPTIGEHEKSSDILLEPSAAIDLIRFYRGNHVWYGKREHAWLEVAFHVGARLGGIRGLDLRDFDADENVLEFHHRPETGTPLKKKEYGERHVGIPPAVTDVLEAYIAHHRYDKHDDHGRQPLFTSSRGRMGKQTHRSYSYMATFPCKHGDCPHGKDPEQCEYRSYHGGHGCPSSRSPHQVRKGSITWQLDRGLPPEVVAERVNASIETIEQYYDKAEQRERLERRRRQYVDDIDINQT